MVRREMTTHGLCLLLGDVTSLFRLLMALSRYVSQEGTCDMKNDTADKNVDLHSINIINFGLQRYVNVSDLELDMVFVT
jgi:hypothetical protein